MLTSDQQLMLQQICKDRVLFNIPLADYTSIRIGGPADAMAWPENEIELTALLDWCKTNEQKTALLGKGSNTLVRDGGVRGAVINLSQGFRKLQKIKEEGETFWLGAEAGVPTQMLVKWSADQGFGGLEVLAGIPGTVGGNCFMNAGTALGETADTLESVTFLNTKWKTETWGPEKMKFEYRQSHFPSGSVILRAVFKLKRVNSEELSRKVRVLFEKRGEAQPIEFPNLGSVFKNPGRHKAW